MNEFNIAISKENFQLLYKMTKKGETIDDTISRLMSSIKEYEKRIREIEALHRINEERRLLSNRNYAKINNIIR